MTATRAVAPHAAPRWHDGRLHADGAPEGAWIDIDGIPFAPLQVTGHGVASLEMPFAPTRCVTHRITVRAWRDGEVLAEAMVGLPPVDEGNEAIAGLDARPMATGVTVVVPVFNAPSAVEACLRSVLAHTAGDARLVVIDDASPDPAIAPLLARLAGQRGVEVLCNPRNLGFTATANRGITHAGRDDVVLLNADTRVAANWLTGLRRAAWRAPDIATATAVSDNAGAFSVPELEQACDWPAHWTFDDAALALRQQAGLVHPELPTGNGFCLYIRRDVIDAIGMLDAEAFPQGYGEENDFCQRASARGWRHVIAGDVYVHHERSRSFGVERRQTLGLLGMQVLRERWPDYERDVGATLFSHARRVLDWRVRRAFAHAGTPPKPRVLCAGGTAPATTSDVWSITLEDSGVLLTDTTRAGEIVERAAAVDVTSALLARWLQRHAIDVVDTTSMAPARLAMLLEREATRLGIARVEHTDTPRHRDAAWHAAREATRSFEGTFPHDLV